MKLYITPTSPYARVARMVAAEKDILGRIEVIVAETRKPGSPYYAINPSGRVPYLVTDDGIDLEDSYLIARYLDRQAGTPTLTPPLEADGFGYGRLEARARSLVDGLSVWVREMRRPETERSPTIIAHEQARAERLADIWQHEVANPWMQGPLNLAQLYLIAGLDQITHAGLVDLTDGRPALLDWARRLREVPSVRAVPLPPR